MNPVLIAKIPEPRLHTVHNLTPFAMFQCDKMGVGRRFYDTVVLKGTFDLAPGTLNLAAVQAPVALVDDYWDLDAPERSSVKHAGEALLGKPSTDVIITGTVRSPAGRPLREWDAAVVVRNRWGTVLDYSVQVTGPRQWRYSSIRGWVLTDPEPTAEVPIRYELAYGGAYLDTRRLSHAQTEREWVVYDPNPSGTGFFDESALDPNLAYRAPQWQPRLQPVTAINREIPLTGLGPIARPWSSRLKYAGTYDEAWERATLIDVYNGLPADYAADFDSRFFQCAHPALITAQYLGGDEHIGLGGMLHEQPQLVMQLPALSVQAQLLDGDGQWYEEKMPLDTVHVALDAASVYLCWRLTLNQERDIQLAAISAKEDK